MKKLFLVCSLILLFISCEINIPIYHTVTFINGNTIISTVKILDGERVAEEHPPESRPGEIFKCWSSDHNGTSFDFNSAITSDITLNAVWEPILLTATFITDDGIIGTQTIKYGGVIDPIELQPPQEGYHFSHWLLNGEVYDIETPVTKEMELFAVWALDTYNVSFMVNGELYAVHTVDYGGHVVPPSDPKADNSGYDFSYWADDDIKFDFNTQITDDIILNAVWTARTYNIRFIANGEVVQTQEVAHGNLVALPEEAVPAQEGFHFRRWEYNGSYFDSATPVTSDMDLEAKFEINTYSVLFMDATNGTGSVTVEHGNTLAKYENLEDTDSKAFLFWTKDGTNEYDWDSPVVEAFVLSAKWVPLYTVRFLNGDSTVMTSKVAEGSTVGEIEPPTPAEVYHFLYWTEGTGKYDFTTPVNSDLDLFACWEVNTYTIRFLANGEVLETQEVEHGDLVALPEEPAPAQNGFHFSGWKYNGNPFDLNTSVTCDMYLEADFEINTYTVMFMNATTEIGSATVEHGNTLAKYENLEDTDSKAFLFWTEDGTNEYDWDFPVVGDIVLSAKWIPLYTVRFLNGDSTVMTSKVVEGSTIGEIEPPTPAEGYHFLYWTEETGEYDFSTPVVSDLDLFACWEINTYTIRFIDADSIISSTTAPHGATISVSEVSVSEPDGKALVGWATAQGDTYNDDNPITGNLDLYAIWANKYVVTFVDNDEILISENVIEGHTVDSLITPEKTGYNFVCWSTKQDSLEEFTDSHIINSNSTVYALWMPDYLQYNVSDGEVSITGNTVTEDIREIIIPDYITVIEKYAFSGCSSISSIVLPNGIKAIGDYAFAGCSSLVDVTIPDSITAIAHGLFSNCTSLGNISFSNNVTMLGNYSFSNCKNLRAIEIPSGIEFIGVGAFSSCSSLSNVTIPENVKDIGYDAFRDCSGLETISLPKGLKTIGHRAFKNCTALESIDIPNSVNNIGGDLFSGCSNLERVTLSSEITTISGDMFNGCTKLSSITIPSGVTSIGIRSFYNCSSLSEISIPDNVSFVGNYAFYGCSALESIHIPEGVEIIYDSTFASCTNLGIISLPSTLKRIEKNAFASCSALDGIILPEEIEYIGLYAFDGCLSLTSIVIPSKVKTIEVLTFSGCSKLEKVTLPEELETIGDSAFRGCSSLSEINIPDSVKAIGSYAFDRCAFTTISLPPSIESIEDYTFSGCKNLSSITIPESVKSIGYRAFGECFSLSNITIPDSVTTLVSYAFFNCKSLSSITIPSSIETMGDHVFYLCTSMDNAIIEDGVSSVGDYAFYQCENLKSVEIGNVEIIGGYAFDGCYKLNTITIASGVKEVGSYAFSRCSALTNLTIPDGVESIGAFAFYYCSNLENISLPDTITIIGGSAFYGCSSLQTIKLPVNLLYIPGSLFNSCYALTNLVIPESVTVIGYQAFASCAKLDSIIIPENVVTIADMAFLHTPITTITIPAKVETIGRRVFGGCNNLDTIYIESDEHLASWEEAEWLVDCKATVAVLQNSVN